MKRKVWLVTAAVIAVAAGGFFGFVPQIAENSMNKVTGTDHRISERA